MGKKIRISYLLNAVGVTLIFAVLSGLFSAGVFGTSTTYIQGICTTACSRSCTNRRSSAGFSCRAFS